MIDKRTGKPLNPAEVGQVQYQYFDNKGNRLNIRRDLNGKYVEGANEMMSLGTKNFNESIYIGPNNPTYTDANGQKHADYRREPTNEVDAAAMEHDMGYDSKRAAGVTDALFNKTTTSVDEKLLFLAKQIIEKAKMGGKDNVTGNPLTLIQLMTRLL